MQQASASGYACRVTRSEVERQKRLTLDRGVPDALPAECGKSTVRRAFEDVYEAKLRKMKEAEQAKKAEEQAARDAGRDKRMAAFRALEEAEGNAPPPTGAGYPGVSTLKRQFTDPNKVEHTLEELQTGDCAREGTPRTA